MQCRQAEVNPLLSSEHMLLFCHYHVLCQGAEHSFIQVCLEHYKGPVACRVQYSLSA